MPRHRRNSQFRNAVSSDGGSSSTADTSVLAIINARKLLPVAAEQTKYVVDQGAVPIFVRLLQSPNEEVRQQAVRALGSIAYDSPNFRDVVLQCGGLHPILTVLAATDKTANVRDCIGTIRNLCRGKPAPPFKCVSPVLDVLSSVIQRSDLEVLTDACSALTYLSDGPTEQITRVIDTGVCHRLVELLSHTSHQVQMQVLKVVGNISAGTIQHKQAILESGAMPFLQKLLSHSKKCIRRKTCLVISNIAAGCSEQIAAVLDNDVLPKVIHLLQTENDDIKHMAASVIVNLTFGTPAQVHCLVEHGCIEILAEFLCVPDAKNASMALVALENILRAGDPNHQEIERNEDLAALLETLRTLQRDPDKQISDKAIQILENYFDITGGHVDGTSSNSMFGEIVNFAADSGEENPVNVFGDHKWSPMNFSSNSLFVFGQHGATCTNSTVPQQHEPIFADDVSIRLASQCAVKLEDHASKVSIADEGLGVHLGAGSEEDDDQESSDEEGHNPCNIVCTDLNQEVPVPPDGSASWEWPLSRQDKKSRISALEKTVQLMDQKVIMQELAELREFRQCYAAEWRRFKRHQKQHDVM